MVSNLVFYQLVLIAVVWVFLMLSGLWPSEPTAARPPPPKSLMPPRRRSTEPKPFLGLTHKPSCEACAQRRRLAPGAALRPATASGLDAWTPSPSRHVKAFLPRSRLPLWRLARVG
jgi:hypothetical protein